VSRRRQEIQSRLPHGVRANKRRILAVCLGRRTERDYLDALKRAFPEHATVVIRTRDADPTRCIAYAVNQSTSSENYFDEVWCVFDVDDHNLEDADRLAAKSDIKLAVSNPCFELWLLLHVVETAKPFTNYKDVLRELTKAVPGYNKSRINFEHFRPGVDKAIDRARRLEANHDGGSQIPNPSSGMWRLAARIVRRQI
jgi:RloB-like protein